MSKREVLTIEPRLIPLSDWNKYHPWPPLGGMRHIRFFSKKNGYERVFKKIGRRVLIDEKEWFSVIAQKNAQDGNIENNSSNRSA